MKNKILCLVLSLIMVLGVLPLSVNAQGDVQADPQPTESYTQFETPAEPQRDLFHSYLLKLGAEGEITPRSSSNLETRLNTERNRGVYRTLKSGVERIAAKGGSSRVFLSSSDIAGITVTVHKNSNVGQAVIDAINSKIDFSLIVDCLRGDCPYEMYWYDITSGFMWYYRYSQKTSGNYITATVSEIYIDFYVSGSYKAYNYSTQNPAVKSTVSDLSYIVSNAKAVVNANKGKRDREKLEAYRDYICSQISYNHDAWSNGQATMPYGDPWQIVYVFDNNPNTNVVCEGYSKAFQFLCELTSFNEAVVCYSVSGYTTSGNGEPGAHMWNIISSPEGNFLVDVTNSEKGYVGENGSLFLNHSPDKRDEYGCTITAVNNIRVVYKYYDYIVDIYGADILTIGLKTFVPIIYASSTTFKESVTVTMGCNTEGASVYYNIDGGTSYWYTGPITITESCVLRARAWKDGYLDSKVVTVEFTKIGDRKLGDVNGNQRIDATDYLMVKRYYLGSYNLDAAQRVAADVDRNGQIQAKDYMMIKRHYLGTYTIRG